MAHQYLNHGEEEEAPLRPADEPERRDVPRDDVPAEEASGNAGEPTTNSAASATPRRQRRSKSDAASEPQAEANLEDTAASEDTDMQALENMGFTHDEATRLIDVAVRLTNSDEARVAEATRKRLQFAKWLVEQGLLDEFSLRD